MRSTNLVAAPSGSCAFVRAEAPCSSPRSGVALSSWSALRFGGARRRPVADGGLSRGAGAGAMSSAVARFCHRYAGHCAACIFGAVCLARQRSAGFFAVFGARRNAGAQAVPRRAPILCTANVSAGRSQRFPSASPARLSGCGSKAGLLRAKTRLVSAAARQVAQSSQMLKHSAPQSRVFKF